MLKEKNHIVIMAFIMVAIMMIIFIIIIIIISSSLPGHGGGQHPGVKDLRGLGVWDPVHVGPHRLLRRLPAHQVEPRRGHLDRAARGHGAHEPALSREGHADAESFQGW